jgi:hypothetical protein
MSCSDIDAACAAIRESVEQTIHDLGLQAVLALSWFPSNIQHEVLPIAA